MSIKTIYLDINELKGLRIDLNFIASKKLLNNLDDYINKEFKGIKSKEIKEYLKNDTNREGVYLGNLFDDDELRELEYLKKNYLIKVFLKKDD